jgi:hypothetical protein
MPEGIKVGKIKQAIVDNAQRSTIAVSRENFWEQYDESISDFGETFIRGWNLLALGSEEKYREEFKQSIEETLTSSKIRHDLTAVEFGGPGSELFKGFTPDFFKRTVGVCLKDIRDHEKKEIDENNNHSIIPENILDVSNTKLLDKVRRSLDAEKVDLIISRLGGPLSFIEKNGAILDRLIRNWYDLLNENGLMFIQFQYVSSKMGNPKVEIKEWANTIQKKFPKVEIEVKEKTMRIHKKIGAPEHLPAATLLFSKTKKEEGSKN